MKDYEKFCLETAEKLGRTLEQKELDFLCWLYNRHVEEQKTKETLNINISVRKQH